MFGHLLELLIVGSVGIGAGIGLVLIFDRPRVLIAKKNIVASIDELKKTLHEKSELQKQLHVAQSDVDEITKSITQHSNEKQKIELLYDRQEELVSTNRVNADDAIVYGRGCEWVYLYTFDTQESLPSERKQKHYPMKLGMSTQQNVIDRIQQQVSGNSTALSERALLKLAFRVNSSSHMERWMHKQLGKKGRKVSDSIGVEWYNTNPTEVEQLFRSYVLQFSTVSNKIVLEGDSSP